jgi:hypothetical protein
MEPHMGADLSQVRVHTGGDSAQAATDLGARAFTVGNDIHFQRGEFAPGTREGDRLLAHELTHVVQGEKSAIHRKEAPGGEDGEAKDDEAKVSQPGDAEEKKADTKADQVTDALHGDTPLRIADDPDWPLMQAKIEEHKEQKAAGPAPPLQSGDGKDAGAKVNPDDMTGIGGAVSVNRFVAAAKELQSSWDETKGKPQERADKLAAAANEELIANQVKPVEHELINLEPNLGIFHPDHWTMGLDKHTFNQDEITDKDASGIAEEVFHEARHAEQFFRMARMFAGEKMEPPQIAEKIGVPLDVAKQARGNPLDEGTKDGVQAKAIYESIDGAGAQKRNELLARLTPLGKARREAEANYHDLENNPDTKPEQLDEAKAEWKEAMDAYKPVHDEYKALPEEKDAWDVASEVKTEYLEEK